MKAYKVLRELHDGTSEVVDIVPTRGEADALVKQEDRATESGTTHRVEVCDASWYYIVTYDCMEEATSVVTVLGECPGEINERIYALWGTRYCMDIILAKEAFQPFCQAIASVAGEAPELLYEKNHSQL